MEQNSTTSQRVFKTIAILVGVGLISAIVLAIMAASGTGFVIINDGERGVKKSGTQYVMEELTPGYHFFIPVYQTVDVQTIRPILINYSLTEGNKADTELLMYEEALKGIDKKGIPISLALSIEVQPVDTQLAEMYRSDGDFGNSFYKKVLQPNREAVQSTLARFSVDTIMDQRAEVEKVLSALIKESYAENPYFKLVKINLKDIVVPDDIRQKQLDVQSARQDALKSEELIAKAENEAKAHEALAQGKANALLIEASAQAEANRIVSQSLTPEILALKRTEKWDGTVPQFVGSGDSQFIFPVDPRTLTTQPQ